MSEETKNLGGRPSVDFDPGVVAILDSYEGPGTVTELRQLLGIGSHVFYRWFAEEEMFHDAVMRVRERADHMVENALFKRAVGYDLDHTVTMEEYGSGAEGEPIHKHRETSDVQHIPGDVGAQRFWLMNRKRDDWTDRKEVTVNGDHAALVEKFLQQEQEQ